MIKELYNMAKKNQSYRLTDQHRESHGVVGIFGSEAKLHDMTEQDLMAAGNASDLFKQLIKK